MSTYENQISLKVLIHKQQERVVFAEANSDFVDILFSFLTMPMGAIVRLLSQQSEPTAIGSFNNLYKSIVQLDSEYFASESCREVLLNTINSAEAECRKLKINIDTDIKPIKCYICEGCTAYVSIYYGSTCTRCRKVLKKTGFLSADQGSVLVQNDIFVSPTASFIINDNLHVIPNVPTSIFAILESCGVTDFAVLEEKIFTVGSTEIVELLKFSIISETPLTSMFLGKNYAMKDTVQTSNLKTSANVVASFKKMKVKILVQKSSNKILLAYCSQDFIDFSFNLLTFPLGRVIGLSNNDVPTRGVDNIHQSVSSLNAGECLNSQQKKDMLLYPQMAFFHLTPHQLFSEAKQIQKIYVTTACTNKSKKTISCTKSKKSRSLSTTKPSVLSSKQTEVTTIPTEGYLKGSTKYMVTDDLVVIPLSTMSCIRYLQSWEVSSSDTEEQMIDIGMEEGMNLLRASFVSSTVLTDGLKHLIEIKPHTMGLVLKKPKVEK